jgi:hypothetical protein
MDKQQIIDEIVNFIEYYTSDNLERDKMMSILEDYINEALNN